MSSQPFMIAPYEVGLELDREPWLLPESAFPSITDAYTWRKRVKRREGNEFLGQLVSSTSVTYTSAVSGAATSFNNSTFTGGNGLTSQAITGVGIDTPAPGSTRLTFPVNTMANGTIFSISGVVGTVGSVLNGMSFIASNSTGTTVDILATSTGLSYTSGGRAYFEQVQSGSVTVTFGGLTFTDDGMGHMLNSLMAVVGSIDYLTGIFSVTFAAIGGGPYDVTVSFSVFDFLPVMGLCTQEIPPLEIENLIAFDTEKANIYNTSMNNFQDISFYDESLEPITWTGTDTNFFDYTNYQNAFFETNNIPGFHAQQITSVLIDTPLAGKTRITFASNVLQVGDTIFITGIVGTVGTGTSPSSPGLNNGTFVVIARTGTSVDITFTSTGLAYGSGGTVFIFQHATTGDGIRWYANDSSVDGWVNFNPLLSASSPGVPGNVLKGGRMILSYRNRMIVLGPIEGDPATAGNFVIRDTRVRWSQSGTVFYSSPVPFAQTFDPLAWRDDIPGRGGFNDAPTGESIVGAQFIRDILIVFFESSTWALRYTGNSGQPFIWSRVNVELGTASQFSTVPFDRGVTCVGNRGIITSDGNNVSRIDLIIPDTVFSFLQTVNSPARVHGVRDYFRELVYWTYIDASVPTTYPNRLLVYNYRENSYSIFTDSYTCFGHFRPSTARLWNTTDINWEDADFLWNSGTIAPEFEDIVAGTNAGYVMIMNQGAVNDLQISIMGITNAPQAIVTTWGNHNLETGQFVKIQNVNGMTAINGMNSQIEVLSNTTFRLLNVNSTLFTPYTDGGNIIRLNNFVITSKQFNPFVKKGSGVFLTKMDLYTDYILDGQISVNVFVDNNSDTPVNVPEPSGTALWQTEAPLDQTINGLSASKTWCRFFCHTRGQFVQIQLTLSNPDMLNDLINGEEFVLHAMTLYMGPAGRLISR